jgi:hypothetical protein
MPTGFYNYPRTRTRMRIYGKPVGICRRWQGGVKNASKIKQGEIMTTDEPMAAAMVREASAT